ncbi:hypothetical protein PENSPDRAFT_681465 [Peniophora sp. CONT]|nr:hypothetical protein PENSPDRAFT_681465 [Peniophora sp. CONT]
MGGRGLGHNPEQLFAAAYASSFASALQQAASLLNKLDAVRDVQTHAAVVLGHPSDTNGFGVEVSLTVEGCEDDELIAAAHDGCAYSRLLRKGGPVRVMRNSDE